MTESPWMTGQEVADYSRVIPETVRVAAAEYDRTGGKSGLKNYQRKPNTERRYLLEDVERWIRGEAPARDKRSGRLARAS